MEKRVAIVGAGISGLLACKYSLEKGFHPVVFEAHSSFGGVWAQTIESTKLQNTKEVYRFTDFPWPSSIKDDFPCHTQVMEYLESYARHFCLFPCIKLNSRVISIDYVGENHEEMESWDLWGGTGKAFDSRGKWHVTVEDTEKCSTEVHHFEFVILCVGRFSGLPNMPEFPPNHGPQVFNGKVMHSVEYSAMDNASAAELIKGKRVTVIGSNKSAVDIATECADANGVEHPCTMIQRTVHWMLPGDNFWKVGILFLYFNRFSELLVHKPGESFLLRLLANLLSPVRWGISKFSESYLRCKLPLREYGMIPKHSFLEEMSACQILIVPDDFYDKVKEGSIILKKSESFKFCKEGIMINGESNHLETDIVIFATGFKGDQKLKNLFISPSFQQCIKRSPTTTVIPLYRQIIHPRIPQLAIIGYSESLSNLYTSEMRCQWLAHFLGGTFALPSIKEMDKEVTMWENYMKQYAGRNFWRSCVGSLHISYNDQLCKDMKCKAKRKKGCWAELFEPYGPLDYAGLTHQ